MSVKNRRTFFKNAGVLAASPWLGQVLPTSGLEQPFPGKDLRTRRSAENDVVIENAEMRLVVSANGNARSLIHKPTRQECLDAKDDLPMFSVTQYLVEDNEWQQSLPARTTEFPVESVRREGDNLI